MNKKILAICLAVISACGIFVGCQKKAVEKVAVIVTDKNGVAVTDENGEVVTELAVPVTDKNGNNVTEKATNAKGEVITDASGNPKTVIVTEGSKDTTTAPASTKKAGGKDNEVPYSTTAPENNKKLDEWTFGEGANVGCNAPNGWDNETVNQVVKTGTDIRVQICPVNYLKQAGYKTADDYAKFYEQMAEVEDGKPKKVSYSKEVYEDGTGIAMLYKANKTTTDASGYEYGKYHMTYIFQTGDRVRVYFVFGNTEEEAKTSIADVIKNTYYRG